SKTERALVEIRERRILEKITYGIGGLRARIGGLVTGSGFAVGPEYFRDDLAEGNILFRATSQFSARQYQLYELEFTLPKLAGNRAFATVLGTHRNYPQMPYYGPGPDSLKTGRSNYRLEESRFGFRAGVRPFRHMSIGGGGALLQVNVGPGTDRRFISTERQFSPAVTPGIDRQTDFLQGSVFASYDYRDIPGGPRSGGLYTADFTYNQDRDLKRHSHRRLNMEIQQYIPLFNQRRVFALRGRSELTWKNPGQVLPFYMQPVLGGSNDLRGFRPFRFHDDNLIVFNAEYRYEVFAGLDMAVFADGGKVFRSKRQWNVHDLEGAYGIGMRFNARNAVFMRIDAGFSHEGFQVWVKFNNVF
ncbi:MAG TPA: BamA/TamA family outer membrane protein, partial [Bryobacteraceae bacterium]|nr:BamA/TamA family outer membrane protein [Bryobacteraceae bacterium]